MKLSFVLLGVSTTAFHTGSTWMKYEYEVQRAFFEGRSIKLRAGFRALEPKRFR